MQRHACSPHPAAALATFSGRTAAAPAGGAVAKASFSGRTAAAPAAVAAGRWPRRLRASTASTASVQTLDVASHILDGMDTVIFDCDGVLWRGNETINNAAAALRELRRRGKRLLFVTNNSSKSRAAYVKKFQGLGIEATADEACLEGSAAAAAAGDAAFRQSRCC